MMDEWVSLRERNFIKEKIIYSTYIYSIYRLISFLKILMQKKKVFFSLSCRNCDRSRDLANYASRKLFEDFSLRNNNETCAPVRSRHVKR